MQPSTAAPKWTDQQLAGLREQFPEWDFWYVPTVMGPTAGTWCAKPSGAMIATCNTNTPDEMAEAITSFQASIADHIEAARRELANAQLCADRRNVLEHQLAGMTRLQSVTA